jgi:hypothetical protein
MDIEAPQPVESARHAGTDCNNAVADWRTKAAAAAKPPPVPTTTTTTTTTTTLADWDVRLQAGTPANGVGVDIFYGGQWYPLCGDSFWDNDNGAELLCQKVGFALGHVANKNDIASPITGPHRHDNAIKYSLPSQGIWLEQAAGASSVEGAGSKSTWCGPKGGEPCLTSYSECAQSKNKGVKVVCK